MTKQQRRAVRRGLRQYGDALRSGDKAGAGMEWAGVVAKVMDYYAKADPTCGELLRLRYLERWREDKMRAFHEVLAYFLHSKTTDRTKNFYVLPCVPLLSSGVHPADAGCCGGLLRRGGVALLKVPG